MRIDGEKLKKVRHEWLLSQRELARLAGLSHPTVWRLENGYTNAHPRTVRKLCEALMMSPKELLKEEK